MAIRLETARLLLRPVCMEDVDSFLAHLRNPQIKRFLLFEPYPETDELCTEHIRQYHREMRKKEAYYLSIEFKEKKGMIGMVSLYDFEKDTSAHIGYWLGQEHWGRGYMSEAVTRVREMAFETLRLEYLLAQTAVDNVRSRKVLEQTGFQFWGLVPCSRFHVWNRGVDYAVYRKMRDAHTS